ncbi:hypothetical protein [Arthrobacter sp. NPDC057013]|uniref:hypothetical protein n=1 Tax=Arthrobacter sp. NPDC057013 TaxID=3345999 RepID=UPI003629634E
MDLSHPGPPWAGLGASIARVLHPSGADVTAEHYIIDAGSQMNVFDNAVSSRLHDLPIPEAGYSGRHLRPQIDQLLRATHTVR